MKRALAVAAGLIADRALGEPPSSWHPVAAFGRLMGELETRWWRDDRAAGTGFLVAGAAVAAGPAVALAVKTRSRPHRRGLWTAPAVASAVYLTVAARSLSEEAIRVADALDGGGLEEARRRVGRLVGRRTEGLDDKEVARAAVESVAENTVDAVVAPALWALLGGAPGALAYRAVNTLDAMVGHHSPRYERFGWASARADDLANWLPARATALAVAVLRPGHAGAVRDAVRHQAPGHPSPNAGVAEAAFAAALDVRLGGVNDYDGRVEHRPTLGFGRPAGAEDIRAACRLSSEVGWLLAGTAVAGTLVRDGIRSPARERRGRSR